MQYGVIFKIVSQFTLEGTSQHQTIKTGKDHYKQWLVAPVSKSSSVAFFTALLPGQ